MTFIQDIHTQQPCLFSTAVVVLALLGITKLAIGILSLNHILMLNTPSAVGLCAGGGVFILSSFIFACCACCKSKANTDGNLHSPLNPDGSDNNKGAPGGTTFSSKATIVKGERANSES
jgi:hypothetical protein